MKSPNNIVIDQIPNWAVIKFHEELDQLREQYSVRVRINDNGRTSSPLRDLPLLKDITEETLKTFVVYYGENGCMKTTIEADDLNDAYAICNIYFTDDDYPIARIEEEKV